MDRSTIICGKMMGKPWENGDLYGQIHHFEWVFIHYFDWAIFNSKLLVYQRVFFSRSQIKKNFIPLHTLWES